MRRFLRFVLISGLCVSFLSGCDILPFSSKKAVSPQTPNLSVIHNSSPTATPGSQPGPGNSDHSSDPGAGTAGNSANGGQTKPAPANQAQAEPPAPGRPQSPPTSSQGQNNQPQMTPLTATKAPTLPMLKPGSSGPAVLRLQQLLASQGYLPVHWKASDPASTPAATDIEALQAPPKGTFTWPYKNTPKSLKSLWKAGSYNTLLKGAVMTYQEANHLTVDGIAGPQVWTSLMHTAGHVNPYGYSYVQVNLSRPQKLTLWHNGKVVLTTLVNSGIPQSPTVKGTFPVYIRYKSQRMSGVTPWGEHYDDPGVPWVNYFYKGEAVHGFPRAHYGDPQSLGCVELPVSKAKIAWNYMHYGTLVHIY